MRRTNLSTLVLASTFAGLTTEARAASYQLRAMRGAIVPHGRVKCNAPKPSDFEKNILRPATLAHLKQTGKYIGKGGN